MSAFFACMVCRITHGILRMLHKGGTAIPGKLALKLCPELLQILSKNVKVLAVTGTNGKTTSARMAEKALQNAGYKVFSNRSGANMPGGITADFVLNADFFLHPKCEYAVIECDEGYTPFLFEAMQPEVCLLTNLFKDQSDRYGSVENTRDTIVSALQSSPDTILCVNADCPTTASVGEKVRNKCRFFGFGFGSTKAPDVSESTRCPRCGEELCYSYVSYSNLGDYRCPRCGYRRPRLDTAVAAVFEDNSAVIGTEGEKHLMHPALPGLYNVYNAAGVITAVTAMGADKKAALAAVEDFERGFGRMEPFALGKKGAHMILVKNTAAADQTLNIIKKYPDPVTLLFSQNNAAGDGRDLAWLYDADFEKLKRMKNLRRVIVSGDCAEELQKRLQKAGVSCELEKDEKKLLNDLAAEENHIFILPSYTAMLSLRQKLIHRSGGKNFWE